MNFADAAEQGGDDDMDNCIPGSVESDDSDDDSDIIHAPEDPASQTCLVIGFTRCAHGQVLSFFSSRRAKFPIDASSAVIACEEMAFVANRASSVDMSF